MRTIIDLPETQLTQLGAICAHEHISRAEVIRRAIDLYIQTHMLPDKDKAFGLWKHKNIDSLSYQQTIRDEWVDESSL